MKRGVRGLLVLALFSGMIGLVCLAVAARTRQYVDADGLLVEPFAWSASGILLVMLSLASFILAAAGWIVRRLLAAGLKGRG